MGQNVFWTEFNLAFPADALTKYTAADQLCISVPLGDELCAVRLYNVFSGIAPILIYAFSNSSIMNGVPVSVWNRRQQIIFSKGLRSGILLEGAYPLYSIGQYKECLKQKALQVKSVLEKQNPTFFDPGIGADKIVSQYRGSEWGFTKLATDQVVRINFGGSSGSFVEVRCVDSQECLKLTSSLSMLGYLVWSNINRVESIIPENEEDLKYNIMQATLYGVGGIMRVNGVSMSMKEYTNQFIESIGLSDSDAYSFALLNRLRNPIPLLLRKLASTRTDVPELLSYCLLNNQRIDEVFDT
jgi:hypothetical protein